MWQVNDKEPLISDKVGPVTKPQQFRDNYGGIDHSSANNENGSQGASPRFLNMFLATAATLSIGPTRGTLCRLRCRCLLTSTGSAIAALTPVVSPGRFQSTWFGETAKEKISKTFSYNNAKTLEISLLQIVTCYFSKYNVGTVFLVTKYYCYLLPSGIVDSSIYFFVIKNSEILFSEILMAQKVYLLIAQKNLIFHLIHWSDSKWHTQ